MATVTLADVALKIAPLAPYIAVPVVEATLLDVAIDFCEETKVWREQVYCDYTLAGTNTVGFSAPADSECIAIIDFKRDGIDLVLAGDELVATVAPEGTPRKVALADGALWIDGSFGAGDTLDFRAALGPSVDATTLPARLVRDWGEALRIGTVARLKRLYAADPRQVRKGEAMQYDFEEQIRKARGRARSGRTNAARAVRYGGL